MTPHPTADYPVADESPNPSVLIPAAGPRILIVTPDIHGPIRNGGIGTAFSALAQTLRRWGFDVDILYAMGKHSEGQPFPYWVQYYAERSIRLIPLPESDQHLDAPALRALSWRVDRWLRARADEYRLAFFPEWMGLAYYALVSKVQGLAYENLPIIVNTHSPEAWAQEGNRALPDNVDDLDRDFMERNCVTRADAVVSPSAYLLDWMREHGWQLPEQTTVIPNLIEGDPAETAPTTATEPMAVEHLVFFGRLEKRKGLFLFCDALDKLPPDAWAQVRDITFLGKGIQRAGFSSVSYLRERAKGWPVPVHLETERDRDTALTYLSAPGIFCVLPSLMENSPYTVLECLEKGIPFAASRVGGIPELIENPDRCLFDPVPSALAQHLITTLRIGAFRSRRAHDSLDIEGRWRSFLNQQLKERHIIPRRSLPQPLVSICLVHYERPRWLSRALDSLRSQSYPNIEVVLIDDGSQSDSAQKFLDRMQEEFNRRDWQILRQENRYLGAARNRAAAAARGEYLLFMDDDNLATANEVETFVRAAVHSDADILTCVAQPFFTETPPDRPTHLWLPLGGATGAGIYRNVFGDANALWKTSVFRAVGGYTEDYGVGHEDWELFAHAVLSGYRLELVPEPLFWYRVNKNGMLRSGDSWADHARSVRPYLKHDPDGLGMAAAYAVCLQQMRQEGMITSRTNLSGFALVRAGVRLSGDFRLWERFIIEVRRKGLRATIAKTRNYITQRRRMG